MKLLNKWLVVALAAVAFVGCDNNETEPSVITTIKNFYLTSTDSVDVVDYTVFSVNADTFLIHEGVTYTGFIQNRDSILYGTSLKAVMPIVTTANVVSAIMFHDTITYTGNDTLNFEQPVRATVYAQNADTLQRYLIKTNVHKIDHELYVWDECDYPKTTATINAERAVMVNGAIYLFRHLDDKVALHTNASEANGTWNEIATTGLPVEAVKNIIYHNGKFYSAINDKIYTSTDGSSWNEETLSGIALQQLLFAQDNEIFALTTDSVVVLDLEDDEKEWTLAARCGDDFPMNDFAVVSEQSPSGKMRYALVGGTTKSGNPAAVWSTENGRYWVNFDGNGRKFPARKNPAVVAYDHNLLMFGGEENGSLASEVLLSPDFGLTWKTADSKIVPTDYTPTTESSILNGNEWRIFIVGGKNADGSFVQRIWSGRKNETYFKEYR